MSKQWYVVQAYSGFEKNVQKALKERIAREGVENYFGQILVPVEEVVDIKNGRKTVSERKFFPGYVLVEMEQVRINDGPFADFTGDVNTVDYERSKLRISVQVFGRETPVELDFGQVEKI